jgi:RNA polymerase sigma factor (sigma-70 family)
MSTLTTGLVRSLGRAGLLAESGPSDGQLLEWFVARRDQAAFEALVRRHGPMVQGVCRRVAGDFHDADDAFQATFLVLARRAASVEPRERVGCWLYGVAYRTALKARASGARRRGRERPLPEPLEAPPARDDWRELQPLLDRELDRLPAKYREAVVLCELQGRSRKEAALQLGLAEGTLSSRLATARKLLASRLARRGLALSAAALATAWGASASAAVPSALVDLTVRTATVLGLAPAPIAALAKGGLQTMTLNKLKVLAAAVLTAGALTAAAGLLPRGEAARPAAAALADKEEKKPQGPTVHGVVQAVDPGKKTITVAVAADGKGKKTEEKTYPFAADAKVILQDVLTKDQAPPEGKIADLTPGTLVELQLADKDKPVVEIRARGPGVHGYVKSLDVRTKSFTVATKGKDGPIEYPLTLGKGAKVIKDDGLGKKGDAPKEGKLDDLAEGTSVLVQLSVDRKVALGVNIFGASLSGTVKSYDDSTKALTVTVKEDGALVDKLLTLAKGAQVDGGLAAGVQVSVRLSVDDKAFAVHVHVHDKDK